MLAYTLTTRRPIPSLYRFCPPKESEFTELEKAFAEARKRSVEQGAVAKAPVAKKPAMKKAPPAAVDKAIDASSAPKAKAEPPLVGHGFRVHVYVRLV